MDETKLDESTLAAQRQEMERLQRVQEQQRLLREFQRQAAQERMQNKVISLLQGNNFSKPGTSTTRIGNTVLVKLPNGQTKPMTRLPKRPFDLVRVQKNAASAVGTPPVRNPRSLISLKKPGANLTPSVSIAPVAKKFPPMIKSHSDSDSEEDIKPIIPKIKRKLRATSGRHAKAFFILGRHRIVLFCFLEQRNYLILRFMNEPKQGGTTGFCCFVLFC
jgi:hypothetical protein